MINLGIACKFHISVDPVYPESYARRPILAGEIRGICFLHSP